MLKPCHRMSAYKKETMIFCQRDERVAYELLDAAAVNDDGFLSEQVRMFFYIIYGCLRVKCHNHDVALWQQLICEGLLNSINKYCLSDYLL